MTESENPRQPTSDVCPRCHRYKDPDSRLCDACAKKEKDYIAERLGSGAADSSTPLNKKEATGICILIGLGLLVVPIAIGWKTAPDIREIANTIGWPPLPELFNKVIMPIGTALFIEFLLTVTFISTINNYRRHHPKSKGPQSTDTPPKA